MAWIYLAASEESANLWLLGCGLSPIVKESDTLKQSFFQECNAEKLSVPQSGMTLQRSKEQCSQESTSLAADSHAKIYHSRGLEQDWQESVAAYFLKSYGLHASYNRDSSSWRMSQESLPGILLEPLAERWPRWAMIVDGECYRLTMWERRTKGKDGSVWPTPSVCGNYNRKGASATSGDGLATAVRMWPTPTVNMVSGGPNHNSPSVKAAKHGLNLAGAVLSWPTPSARDWKDGRKPYYRKGNGQTTQDTIGRRLAASGETINGLLNPEWVEWLMGYQCGTTALSALVTEWFRNKSKKLLKG